MRAQQPLLRMNARQEGRYEGRREEDADPRVEGRAPAQRADDQPQVAGVADDAVDAPGHQRVPRLDGDQPAEPVPEHEDRPEPQRPARGEEGDADPADGVAVDGPE